MEYFPCLQPLKVEPAVLAGLDHGDFLAFFGNCQLRMGNWFAKRVNHNAAYVSNWLDRKRRYATRRMRYVA